MLKRYVLIAVSVGLIVVAATIWHLMSTRSDRVKLDRLARDASGFAAKPEAVEQLAENNSEYSHRLLLTIAKDPGTNPGVRAAALSYLAKHRVQCGSEIALLLQPQESLAVRQASVEALAQIGCPDDCIRNVLHYEERLFHGEKTSEQFVERKLTEQTRESVRTESDRLEKSVISILQQNDQATTAALTRVYGLGGREPAQFALHIADMLPAATVCPLVRQSLTSRREAITADDDLSSSLKAFVQRHCTSVPHVVSPGMTSRAWLPSPIFGDGRVARSGTHNERGE